MRVFAFFVSLGEVAVLWCSMMRSSLVMIGRCGVVNSAGDVLVSTDFAFENGSVRVWDLTTGAQALHVPGHADVIMDAQFSPSGGVIWVSV